MRYRHIFKTAFLRKMYITSKSKTDFSLTSENKPQSSLVLHLQVRDRRTRCAKCWSNLTLKCYANTFVKVDAQIEEECRHTISYQKGHSYPKLFCKKLNNFMLSALYILKNFYSSKLLCICPSLLETNRNKVKYSIYEKLSRVFSVAGSRFEEE